MKKWEWKRIDSTAEKMKFSIKYFFSKCDQIHSFLWIWSHLLKKPLIENFLCSVMKAYVMKVLFLISRDIKKN